MITFEVDLYSHWPLGQPNSFVGDVLIRSLLEDWASIWICSPRIGIPTENLNFILLPAPEEVEGSMLELEAEAPPELAILL